MTRTPKCRCSNCGALVEQWIGMECIPCHDLAVAIRVVDTLIARVRVEAIAVLPAAIKAEEIEMRFVSKAESSS